MSNKLAWIVMTTTLALPSTSSASALERPAHAGLSAQVSSSSSPKARGAAYGFGQTVWISANSRSAQGSYLRVAIQNSGAGGGSPAVLKTPDNRGLFPNLRRAQQWRVERNYASDFSGSMRLRNIYSDKCLTAARPHASPVYLQYCGSILGQAWLFKPNGMLWSLNYNQTFPAGCSCRTLDIPNFRNTVDTPLVVAYHTGTWNQIWDIDVVPAALR